MKKKLALVLILLLAAGGGILLPRMVKSTIPTAYYITPSLRTYENVVNCTGTIQSEEVRQVYTQGTLVADTVYVSVGDIVREGDPLLRIDHDATAGSSLALDLLQMQDSVSAADLAALASSYGLPALGGLDTDTIQALLAEHSASAPLGTPTIGEELEGEIVAPISGVVTGVEIQPGVPAASGKAVVTIADNRRYRAQVSIREEDIGRIQVGDVAKVRGVGFPGSVYMGTITKIYPTARKTLNGTSTETVIDAEVTLDAVGAELRPGLSAKVEILGGNDYNLITVPYEAVKQDENNNEYVYIYEGGKLKKQVVVTGKELTNEVEILDGISSGSVVVYNPPDTLKEGAMIHLEGRANVD